MGLLITAFALCNSLAALEWPLPDAVMVRNFGFNDRGRPSLGTVFEGEGDIRAAGDGEMIFSCTGKEIASRLPSPLGAWSAIDHDDGLISVYGRGGHETGIHPPSKVSRGIPIAITGSSGWSRRSGLYFVLYDRKERRWVNQIRNINQGKYSIVVNAVDALLNPRGSRLPPHRILCSVNGEEIGSLSFDTINAKDGVLLVSRNGQTPAKRIYANYPAFEIGEVQFNRGQANLEVIVQDLAGNSRSTLIRIIVE